MNSYTKSNQEKQHHKLYCYCSHWSCWLYLASMFSSIRLSHNMLHMVDNFMKMFQLIKRWIKSVLWIHQKVCPTIVNKIDKLFKSLSLKYLDSCTMTRMSALLLRFFYKAWFFGAYYYWMMWTFLIVSLCSFIYVSLRPKQTVTQGLLENDFENEDAWS